MQHWYVRDVCVDSYTVDYNNCIHQICQFILDVSRTLSYFVAIHHFKFSFHKSFSNPKEYIGEMAFLKANCIFQYKVLDCYMHY